MINFIIWLLTDTNFIKEWSNGSFLNKLNIVYTVSAFILLEFITICFLIDLASNFIMTLN